MTEERRFELGGKPLKDLTDEVLAEALEGLAVIPEWRRAIQQEQALRVRFRRESEDGDAYEGEMSEHAFISHTPGF